MKIIVQKIDLEAAISLTLKALSSKVDGKLGIITMGADKNNLTLTTGDDGIIITATAVVEVIEKGIVNIPGKLLYESIRKMNNFELEIEKVGSSLIINCSDGHVSLPIVDVGWESYERINKGAKVIIAKNNLKEIIKKTTPFSSTDNSRPILRGVNLVSQGTMLTGTALDGFRVAKVAVNLLESAETFNVIVPAKALNCIDGLIDSDGNVEILISNNENLLQIKTDDIEIIVTLLQGDFIDINRILPKEFISTMSISKDALLQALDRAVLFSDSYKLATFKVGDKNVVIKAESCLGESVSKLNCKTDGEDLDIAFNAKYIISILKLLSDDNAVVSFSSQEGAAVIKEQNALYLFLPLKRI